MDVYPQIFGRQQTLTLQNRKDSRPAQSVFWVQGGRDLRKELMLGLRLGAVGGKGHLVEPLNPFLGDQ